MPRKKASKRSDDRYEYKIDLGRKFNGEPNRKSFYSTKSMLDAKRKAEAWKLEHAVAEQLGERLVDTEMLFSTWARRWLIDYKKGTVKANTYHNNYAAPTENHLIPYFGSVPLHVIKPLDVRTFFKRCSKTMALDTQKKLRVCLSQIFEAAIENDLCTKNPVTKTLKLTSEIPPSVKQTWSQEQYDAALKFAKEKNRIDIITLMKTGLTRSELLGLKFSDAEFDKSILHVRQGVAYVKGDDGWETVVDGLKNKYRERTLPIDKELCILLAARPRTIYYGGNVRRGIPKIRVEPEFIFHNSRGGTFEPNNWTHRVFEPFMKELHASDPSIPILTPHELRHTRATLWYDQGVDLFTISRMMGHVDLRMEKRIYVHDNVEQMRSALKFE